MSRGPWLQSGVRVVFCICICILQFKLHSVSYHPSCIGWSHSPIVHPLSDLDSLPSSIPRSAALLRTKVLCFYCTSFFRIVNSIPIATVSIVILTDGMFCGTANSCLGYRFKTTRSTT
ncbi:hypothetical protein F4823DRAFT_147453 [Ustulina deusta]|nr:hypothetical protein F4823DRAFT_147453 [Ustulina deusta]